jgi:hypothetical protein
MRKTLKTILLAGTLLGLGIADAQQAKELTLSGNDVLRVEVKFNGPNADKVTSVYLAIASTDPALPDQPGFGNGFNGSEAKAVTPMIFKPEIKIPESAVDGDYKLSVIAIAGPFRPSYEAGKDFKYPVIHIKNQTFTRPSIEVKPLP